MVCRARRRACANRTARKRPVKFPSLDRPCQHSNNKKRLDYVADGSGLERDRSVLALANGIQHGHRLRKQIQSGCRNQRARSLVDFHRIVARRQRNVEQRARIHRVSVKLLGRAVLHDHLHRGRVRREGKRQARGVGGTAEKLLVKRSSAGEPVLFRATTALMLLPASSDSVESISGLLLHGASELAGLIFTSYVPGSKVSGPVMVPNENPWM